MSIEGGMSGVLPPEEEKLIADQSEESMPQEPIDTSSNIVSSPDQWDQMFEVNASAAADVMNQTETAPADPVQDLNLKYSEEMRALEAEAEGLSQKGKSVTEIEAVMKEKSMQYESMRSSLLVEQAESGKNKILDDANKEFTQDMKTLEAEAEELSRQGKSTEDIEKSMADRRAQYDALLSSLVPKADTPEEVVATPEPNDEDAEEAVVPTAEVQEIPVLTDEVVSPPEAIEEAAPVPESKEERENAEAAPGTWGEKLEKTEAAKVTSPRLETGPVKMMSDVSKKYKEQFGIEVKDLESVPGFSKLTRAEQLYVLENLTQLSLGQVYEQAESEHKKEHEEKMASSNFFAKVAYGVKENLLGKIDVVNRQKEIAKHLKGGGVAVHGDNLAQLVRGMVANGPKVYAVNGGGFMVAYTEAWQGMDESAEKVMESFNGVAAKLSKIPFEASYEGAPRGIKKEYEKLKGEYERERNACMAKMRESGLSEEEIIQRMAKTEENMSIDRFLTTSPEAVKELKSIEDRNAWVQAAKNVATSQGLYASLGFLGRSVLAGASSFVAAPLVAAGVSSLRAWNQSGAELREKDRLARLGVGGGDREEMAVLRKRISAANELLSSENKDGKVDESAIKAQLREDENKLNQLNEGREIKANIIDAKGEFGAIRKLEILNSRIDEVEDFLSQIKSGVKPGEKPSAAVAKVIADLEGKKEKLNASLRDRVQYTEDKIKLGKLNFGVSTERLDNRYQLLSALSQAKVRAELAGAEGYDVNKLPEMESEITKAMLEGKDPQYIQELTQRYDKIAMLNGVLARNEESIDSARSSYRWGKVRNGAVVGAGFALLGAVARDFVLDHGIFSKSDVVESVTGQQPPKITAEEVITPPQGKVIDAPEVVPQQPRPPVVEVPTTRDGVQPAPRITSNPVTGQEVIEERTVAPSGRPSTANPQIQTVPQTPSAPPQVQVPGANPVDPNRVPEFIRPGEGAPSAPKPSSEIAPPSEPIPTTIPKEQLIDPERLTRAKEMDRMFDQYRTAGPNERIEIARQIGVSEEEIERQLAARNPTSLPQQSPTQLREPQFVRVADAAPQGPSPETLERFKDVATDPVVRQYLEHPTMQQTLIQQQSALRNFDVQWQQNLRNVDMNYENQVNSIKMNYENQLRNIELQRQAMRNAQVQSGVGQVVSQLPNILRGNTQGLGNIATQGAINAGQQQIMGEMQIQQQLAAMKSSMEQQLAQASMGKTQQLAMLKGQFEGSRRSMVEQFASQARQVAESLRIQQLNSKKMI